MKAPRKTGRPVRPARQKMHVSVSRAVHDAVRARAAADQRSLNATVERALRHWLGITPPAVEGRDA